jgi:hypothetical protein
MKITIESTDKILRINNVPARLWEGKTDSGVEVICFITRIAVKKEADNSVFEKELKETKAPSPEAAAFDLRLVL